MSKRANKQSRRFQDEHPPRERSLRSERLAVHCIGCKMWFDTDKGWPVDRIGHGIPLCQHCGAPLMQMEYDKFIETNAERLDEVMTWEWPDGVFWTAERMEADER